MTDAYRSYVIRVRRRLDPPKGIQVELEDLLGGGRAAISGAEGYALAERLRSLILGPAADGNAEPAERQGPGGRTNLR